MPLIKKSTYRARGPFRYGHINTIYPALFRKVEGVRFERERVETRDGDFLDFDWSAAGSRRLIILLHGLEGSAGRPYIRGMARYFNQRGWDALGFNFRGCSGEPNRKLRSYHVGETADLKWAISFILDKYDYESIVLAGFSLGGNVVLKYLGETGAEAPSPVRAGIAFSVPCDVESANREIDKWQNWLYRYRFIKSLNEKVREKALRYPEELKLPREMPKDFRQFDDRFTAPIHGFRDADDYWTRNSSLQFLPGIRRPALLVSARDDSFLSPSCYPCRLAEEHPDLYLEIPRWGGHVGFVSSGPGRAYWSEQRAFQFVEEKVLNLRADRH
ncbi:MAG: alpha/beta fold hydrolase [Phaeodactylibacter sp.]|nr:alpha/beta fold hydrolase [Phaeodactylibacter sp.]MCB9264680.1 alpha/beta fold hydrolase [Lewinellaceae bacterium]MCB9287109.1 alpha/beta fold hydrolase [Lewinellaceae bacterium]